MYVNVCSVLMILIDLYIQVWQNVRISRQKLLMSFILFNETKYYSFHALANKEELVSANMEQKFQICCLV